VGVGRGVSVRKGRRGTCHRGGREERRRRGTRTRARSGVVPGGSESALRGDPRGAARDERGRSPSDRAPSSPIASARGRDRDRRLGAADLAPRGVGKIARARDGAVASIDAGAHLFIGCMGLAMSTMTTLLDTPVSRTQMNFSLSIVRLVNEMHCGLMPALVSWGRGGGGGGQLPRGDIRAARAPRRSKNYTQALGLGQRAAAPLTETTSFTVTGGVAMVGSWTARGPPAEPLTPSIDARCARAYRNEPDLVLARAAWGTEATFDGSPTPRNPRLFESLLLRRATSRARESSGH